MLSENVPFKNLIQHGAAGGPSFQRLGGSDKAKVAVLYVGVLSGVALALKGQFHLWTGTNKVERN